MNSFYVCVKNKTLQHSFTFLQARGRNVSRTWNHPSKHSFRDENFHSFGKLLDVVC